MLPCEAGELSAKRTEGALRPPQPSDLAGPTLRDTTMTQMIEKAGLYWHFVDLVWVFVFTCFYLL